MKKRTFKMFSFFVFKKIQTKLKNKGLTNLFVFNKMLLTKYKKEVQDENL